MTAIHYRNDPNRLETPLPGYDRPTTEWRRGARRRDRLQDNAYRHGWRLVPWEHGYRARGRSYPWPEYCRDMYAWGVADRERDDRERMADRIERLALAELRRQERARAQRRKVRRQQAGKIAAWCFPDTARRVRRWRKKRRLRPGGR